MISRLHARVASLVPMILFALPILFEPASAATYLIRPDGTGDFPTIQEAIGASSNGDVIQLADGVYLGDGNSQIMFFGKAITVESVSGNPAACGLNAVLFMAGEGRDSILRGVRVVWDFSTSSNVVCWGSSPTFDNCSFEDCLDSGGVVVDPGAPLFRNCRFSGNSFGIWLNAEAGDPVIEDCTFINNQRAIHGNSATVSRCWFEGATGGAVTIQGGTMSFSDCTFLNNHASSGGAIYVSASSGCHLTRCTFVGNTASNFGSAIVSTDQTNVTLDNCIVASNVGGAPVACDPLGHQNVPILSCCDLYGNSGGGWTDCIANQLPVRGNLAGNPIFCDPANKVFTVRSDSPCAEQHNPLCGQIGAWGTGCEPAVDVEQATPNALNAFADARGLPNPFTAGTSIVYSIPASVDAPLSLRIHDAQGRLVRELANGSITAGSHAAFWDGRDQQGNPVAAGTYFYRIEWNGLKAGGTLIRIR